MGDIVKRVTQFHDDKQMAMPLGKDIGFDPVDAGPLKSARYIEPMGMLRTNLGYALGMGPKIGLKPVRV